MDNMHRMLLVDTCGNFGGVLLATIAEEMRGGSTLQVAAVRSLPGRETQERLMTAIAEVLRECSLEASGVHVLAVVTGPGSFTGVRIGMAAVKGLAEALEKPVVAVSRLAVLAAQCQAPGGVEAWIDAGRGDVFRRVYRTGDDPVEAMLHATDAVAELREGRAAVVMEEGLQHLHPQLQVVPEVGVREALPLAAEAFFAGRFADTALLDANYLRVPDAELARRAAAQRSLAIAGKQG